MTKRPKKPDGILEAYEMLKDQRDELCEACKILLEFLCLEEGDAFLEDGGKDIVTMAKHAINKAEANSEFIIKAYNSHYDLLEAFKAIIDDSKISDVYNDQLLEELQQTISKAESK